MEEMIKLTPEQEAIYNKRRSQARTRLKNLSVIRVDLVGTPANLRPFLVVKNIDEIGENDMDDPRIVEVVSKRDGTFTRCETITSTEVKKEASKEKDQKHGYSPVSKKLKDGVISELQGILERTIVFMTMLKGIKVVPDATDTIPFELSADLNKISSILFMMADDLKSANSMKKFLVDIKKEFVLNPKVQEAALEVLREFNERLMSVIARLQELESSDQGGRFVFGDATVNELHSLAIILQELTRSYPYPEIYPAVPKDASYPSVPKDVPKEMKDIKESIIAVANQKEPTSAQKDVKKDQVPMTSEQCINCKYIVDKMCQDKQVTAKSSDSTSQQTCEIKSIVNVETKQVEKVDSTICAKSIDPKTDNKKEPNVAETTVITPVEKSLIISNSADRKTEAVEKRGDTQDKQQVMKNLQACLNQLPRTLSEIEMQDLRDIFKPFTSLLFACEVKKSQDATVCEQVLNAKKDTTRESTSVVAKDISAEQKVQDTTKKDDINASILSALDVVQKSVNGVNERVKAIESVQIASRQIKGQETTENKPKGSVFGGVFLPNRKTQRV